MSYDDYLEAFKVSLDQRLKASCKREKDDLLSALCEERS